MTPTYDLLPSEFKNDIRLRQIIFAWCVIALLSAATLVVAYGSSQFRSMQQERARQHLASSATPLLDLKRRSARIDQEIKTRRKWTPWVESAKPNDDTLQTAAAIIASIGNDEIRINHLHVKLPIEHSLDEKSIPDWALPHIHIHAQANGKQVLNNWITRLNLSDRIDNAQLTAETFDNGIPNAEVRGTPLATGVLP